MDWLKLDSKGILRGSLAESNKTSQLIWIKLLAMANETRDRDGYLRYKVGKPYTLEFIAQVCNVTMPELEKAIDLFKEDVREGHSRVEFDEDKSLYLYNWKKYQSKPEKTIAKQIAIDKAKKTKKATENMLTSLRRIANDLNAKEEKGRFVPMTDGSSRILDTKTGDIKEISKVKQ